MEKLIQNKDKSYKKLTVPSAVKGMKNTTYTDGRK